MLLRKLFLVLVFLIYASTALMLYEHTDHGHCLAFTWEYMFYKK